MAIAATQKFRLLRTIDESFELMLACIQAARRSILLEMYIYTASPIGEQFRDALIKASERGVQVRVLIDALGSVSMSDKFWEPLMAAGGQFRRFNPLKLDRMAFRNHRKLLVCDEQVAFVGGFNIAPEYQGDGVTRGWHDLGLQISGTLVRELAASFETLFALADFQHKRFARFRRSAVKRIISSPDGQLLLGGPGRGLHYFHQALLADLNKARHVDIISAYFLPTRQIRRSFRRVIQRGGRVRLILAGKSDVLLSQIAGRYLYQGLLRAGIQIFEYVPQILHTKLFLLDQIVYAGSANIDRRSLYINYELILRLPNSEMAADAGSIFEETLARCRRIDQASWSASRTFWGKLKERWAFIVLARIDPYLARRLFHGLS